MTGFTPRVLQFSPRLLPAASRSPRPWRYAVLTAALLVCALPAFAQPQHEEGYDEVVLRALAAYDAGRWGESRRLFEQAHGLHPTARTLRTIGMAAFNQGDYVAALQNLHAARVDQRKPLTDQQRAHVDDLIERANQQVGRFRLRVEPQDAHVRVDGKAPLLVSGELVLPPGQHEISARAGGYQVLKRKLDVQAKDRALLDLRLTPQGTASSGGPAAAPAPPPAHLMHANTGAPDAATQRDSSRTTWGVIALSVGGASLIAAGITGGLALSQKSELDDACPDRRCPPAEHDLVERYDTLRLVSGVALAAGAAGVATAALLLLSGDDEPERVQALIAPGWVGVRGRL